MSGVQFADGFFDDAWAQVPRDIIRDPALSWKAKGLVAWLCSHGPNFRFNRAYIVGAGPDGEDSVKAGLRELREANYLTVERGHDDGGRLTSVTFYRLHRAPQNPRSEPNGGKPTSGENHQEGNPTGGQSGTKVDQEKEDQEKRTTAAPGGTEAESAPPHLQAVPDLNPQQSRGDEGAQAPATPRDANEAALTVNQRATRLAQDHYDRLGRMGNVPAWAKIIRKALEHGFTPDTTRAALDHIADHNWTLTEERLAITLRGGPRRPSGPPPSQRQARHPRSAGTRPAGAQAPAPSRVEGY